MFNLWRRAQAWYILAWQAESIFVSETWIGPDQGLICQSPSAPRGAADWSTAGGKTNPFIGTRAWLIKQVPLGQKAAGVGLLHVPVSARLAGRHTLAHKGRGDATAFLDAANVQNTNTWEDVSVWEHSDFQIVSLSRGVGCARFGSPTSYCKHQSTTHTLKPNSTALCASTLRTNLICFRLSRSAYFGADTYTGCKHYHKQTQNEWKSCQDEHRVKIRHPCPPSQPKMSWSNLGRFQRER